jgi:hypothetical protein
MAKKKKKKKKLWFFELPLMLMMPIETSLDNWK